ncbi:MAG: heavy-metal-associated domain-containing protein [Gaiellaceae bacterium]
MAHSTIQLTVRGMHCAGCERTVSVVLEALDGVREVKADRDAEQVTVTYDDDRVSESQVRDGIELAGYRVG